VIKIREEFRACLDEINDRKRRIEETRNDLKKLDDEIKSIDRSRKGDTK
jgi:cell shape-determining protein MreC